MNLTIVASRPVFEQALASARELGKSEAIPLPGLHSPLDNIRAYLDEAWAAIEGALRHAFLYGKQQAVDLFESARVTTRAMLKKAASKAGDLQTALLEKLRIYIRDMITGSIALLPSEYRVGDRSFVMQSIGCTQKVMLSGSLEASLDNVFELTSEGSFEIEAHYAAAKP